jgi:hypothetical protein
MNEDNSNEKNRTQVWTTSSPLDFSNVTDTTLVTIGNHTTSIKEEDERGVKPKQSLAYSKSFNSSVQSNQQNGSTLKLIHGKEDSDSNSKEVRIQQACKIISSK